MGILINGRDYSYASLEISVVRAGRSSEIFVKIDEISYSDKLDIGLVRGTNVAPLGWTKGQYNPEEGSMRMSKSDFQRGIVEAIGDGWMGANVQILVKYSDDGEPVITDKINARINGASDAHSSGPDNLKTNVSFQPIMIERNGVKPIKGALV